MSVLDLPVPRPLIAHNNLRIPNLCTNVTGDQMQRTIHIKSPIRCLGSHHVVKRLPIETLRRCADVFTFIDRLKPFVSKQVVAFFSKPKTSRVESWSWVNKPNNPTERKKVAKVLLGTGYTVDGKSVPPGPGTFGLTPDKHVVICLPRTLFLSAEQHTQPS